MNTNYYIIGKNFELEEQPNINPVKKRLIKKTPYLLIDIGFYIIGPLLIAIPIGLYIDRTFQTKNIFTLMLIFLGFISTIYNLIRLSKLIYARN